MLVRSLNKEFFEFRPTFKLLLSGNHKPKIGGVDQGIWRRVKFVPWPVTIPLAERRQMNEVIAELWSERSGILNWLVEGALAYLNYGLQTPVEVVEATEEYREEMDPIGVFISQRVESVPANPDGSPASFVNAKAMYGAFADWAEENAVRPWTLTSFGTVMGEKNMEKDRVTSGVRYLNVRLKELPVASRDRIEQDADCEDVVPV